jgi:ABC-2 type transport system ATP-binding protein
VETLADHVGVLSEGRLIAQMPRDQLRKTVQRYRVEVPDGWQAPPELRVSGLHRAPSGRELRWTLVGEERDVIARLTRAGAMVRDVLPLALEEATVALLTAETTT